MSSASPPGGSEDPLVSPVTQEDGPPSGEQPHRHGLLHRHESGPVQQRPDGHNNMLPERERRRAAPERFLVRLVATAGIIGIGVAIGAIMTSQHSQGWLIGLVVSAVSVILAGILWSSRQL